MTKVRAGFPKLGHTSIQILNGRFCVRSRVDELMPPPVSGGNQEHLDKFLESVGRINNNTEFRLRYLPNIVFLQYIRVSKSNELIF